MAVIATPLPQRLRNTDRIELNRSSWQAAGLVGWWPLGAYPDGKDKSGYGNNGTLTSPSTMPAFADGFRRGLDCSQVDQTDYLSLGNPAFFTNRFSGNDSVTLMCWSKTAHSSQNGGYIFSKNEWYMWLDESGNNWKLIFYADGSAGDMVTQTAWDTGGNLYAADEWVHLTFTWTGVRATSALKLYRNGISVGQDETAAGIQKDDSGDDLKIASGTLASTGQKYDDMRWYNRALSANEVAAIYYQTRDGGYGDLARQPTRFHHLPVAAAVSAAPTGTLYGPLAGCFGGAI